MSTLIEFSLKNYLNCSSLLSFFWEEQFTESGFIRSYVCELYEFVLTFADPPILAEDSHLVYSCLLIVIKTLKAWVSFGNKSAIDIHKYTALSLIL